MTRISGAFTFSQKRRILASMQKVIIIGAGFAGLQAARRLARQRDLEITLIDRSNHHLFQPLLYQVATAGLSPSDIASPVRSVLSSQRNLRCLMAEVTAIDRTARKIQIDQVQQLDYDYLIVAAGGQTSYFGHSEWADIAPGLKSLEDALRIRHRLLAAFEKAEKSEDAEEQKRLLTIAVVGGGPTGVELCGALSELTRTVLRRDFRRIRPEKSRIVLIEGSPRLLAAFPESLSHYTAEKLRKKGVEIHLGQHVTALEPGRLTTAEFTLEAHTVLWAAGVQASPLGAMLETPLDRAGRVPVDSQLQVGGDDRVYCVGDLAAFDPPLPGVAQVAMQQGRCAAENILKHRDSKPLRSFRYFDKGSMATIGRSAAVVSSGKLQLRGRLAWLSWLFIHVLYLVDFQNQLVVLVRWTWSYFTWSKGARLITRASEGEE